MFHSLERYKSISTQQLDYFSYSPYWGDILNSLKGQQGSMPGLAASLYSSFNNYIDHALRHKKTIFG